MHQLPWLWLGIERASMPLHKSFFHVKEKVFIFSNGIETPGLMI